MNLLQELMVLTMEESGELIQECSKAIRKFDTLEELLSASPQAMITRDKLVEELGDVYCMIDLMIDHGVITEDQIYARAQMKAEKLKKWSKLYGVDD